MFFKQTFVSTFEIQLFSNAMLKKTKSGANYIFMALS